MKTYQDNGRTIVIRVKGEFNRFNFTEVLKILKEEFQEEQLEFQGWLNGSKVISIDEENYTVLPSFDRIKLKLTKSKGVMVQIKNKDRFKEYTEYISSL